MPLCVLVGFLAFAGAPAEALVTHYYSPSISAKINEGIPVEGPHGEKIAQPGPLKLGGVSMTVDAGHLWAVEGAARIDEFAAATGAFISQPITSPAGVSFTAADGPAGVAIGHATGESELYVGERTSQGTAVAVYSESGTLEGTWTGAETPAGAFAATGSLSEREDVAVDNSTDPLDEHKGDVYVSYCSEAKGSGSSVVDIFHPEADGKEHYVGQIIGASPSEPFKCVRRMAVDSATGDVIVIAENALDILEPTALGEYVLAHKITGTPAGPFGEAFNLSTDGVSGDIYVDELDSAVGLGVVVDQYSSTGAYLGRITGEETPHGRIEDVYTLAVDPESHNVYVADVNAGEMDVFGANIVFPDVTTEVASSVTSSGATLNGTVNPDQAQAGAVTCRFEWGTTKAFGKTAPCEPEGVAEGASPVPVHAAVSGLVSDTTYFYRLQATNGNGTNAGEARQDEEFTTAGPGFSDESVTDLASTSVTFDASIDPHKVPSSVYFQYGTDANYEADVPAPPGEAIGSGEGDVEVVPRHVQGLQPGTTYHYRVVVITEPKSGEVVVYDGPDRVFTTETAAVSELPDGRHWEMVSPPDKKGALIEPIKEVGVVQAADGGDAISYEVSTPVEAEPQGNANDVQVLSTRSASAGWTSRVLQAVHSNTPIGPTLGSGEEYPFFSADLSQAVVQPQGSFLPSLAAEASESTAMLRTLDGACAASCYRPLVTSKPGFANVPPGTLFGQEPNGECEVIFCGPKFIDATPDLGHIVVAIEGELSGERGLGLVEWSDGKLAPIEVLPGGTQGSLSIGEGNNVRGAISRDGSRIVLTNSSFGDIYVRDMTLEKTIQVNVAEPACVAKGKCASGGGEFQLASADGSKLFFTNQTDAHRLTKDSGEVGSDLYECEVIEKAGELECKLSDIAKEAVGALGASEDGSYLYFVANSVLAAGAVPGECDKAESSPGATCNLYLRHAGVTKFVALLSAEDAHDWATDQTTSSARVSPNGMWAEFMSQRSVTGYDNRDAGSGRSDAEVYLYDAGLGRVVCASCDPTGARPTGAEYFQLEPGSGGLTGGPRDVWKASAWVAANVPGWIKYSNSYGRPVYQPRYLSDSGRLFFNSGDALVPQDVNGTEDVYEYEPAGVGDCTEVSATFNERSGGCVGLISAGTSPLESAFLDASESGGDVFFMTYSRLQPQDYDNALDVYDAHECTSLVPCFPASVPQPPACTTAEACRAAPTPQPPSFGAPASATFSGAGNLAPGSGGAVAARSLARERKLAKALRACKKRAKKRRARCERRARARYGSAKSGKGTAGKGNR
jgi:hypothetical protein